MSRLPYDKPPAHTRPLAKVIYDFITDEGAGMDEEEKLEKVKLFLEQDLRIKAYEYDQLDSFEEKLAFLETALHEAYGCDRPPPGTLLN